MDCGLGRGHVGCFGPKGAAIAVHSRVDQMGLVNVVGLAVLVYLREWQGHLVPLEACG